MQRSSSSRRDLYVGCALAVGVLAAVCSLLLHGAELSRANVAFFTTKKVLGAGWFPGAASVDLSDGKWRSLRERVPQYCCLAVCWRLLTWMIGGTKEKRLLVLSSVGLIVALRAGCLAIFGVLAVNLSVAKCFEGRPKRLAAWVCNALIVAAVHTTRLKRRRPDAFWGWTDSTRFAALRGVSYLVDTSYNTKDDAYYLKAACYFVYLPLVLHGPLLTFNDFSRQLDDDDREHGNAPWRLCRVLGVALAVEAAQHVWYYSAFLETGSLRLLAPGSAGFAMLYLAGYVTTLSWLHWEVFGAWAAFDGFTTKQPHDLPRVPYLVTGVADFLKRWNLPMQKWLASYVYSPLRSVGCPRWLAVAGVFATSTLWHAATLDWVAWGASCCAMVLLDHALSKGSRTALSAALWTPPQQVAVAWAMCRVKLRDGRATQLFAYILDDPTTLVVSWALLGALAAAKTLIVRAREH